MTEPAYGCDRCGRAAEVISVLPGIFTPPRVARVTCEAHVPHHAPDAYGGTIDHYCGDGGYTLREHLLTKRHGRAAVALMDEALELARRRAA